VYGDYDVDGICGAALLVLFLREAARVLDSDSVITYYIPSRIEEGYGLNKSALLAIRDGGADSIVTVDCGSVSAEEAAYAREIGLDILITDHHDPDPDRLPECILVNPKLGSGGKSYPFERLSGSGVAFKLCGAVIARCVAVEQSDKWLRACLHSVVDLVCVATIADVMPLIDENRTIVKYGLSMLKKGARPALRELLAVSGIDMEKLTARDLAFGIAPRINALGRMGDASDGVEFFLEENADRIREIARRMNELNYERRKIQEDCFSKCMELYRAELDGGGNPRFPFLLFRVEGAYEGVAGIVAGKIRQGTGFPCAVLTESQDDKGMLKGSARSGGRLDLIGLLKKYESLFERYGGHTAAAGFTIRTENEAPLREALSGGLRAMLAEDPDLLCENKGVELELEPEDITAELGEAIGKLAPFGNGNPKPLLMLSVPASEIGSIRLLGQEGKHLRFSAGGLSCIFFGGADTVFPDSGVVRIIGCPEINYWNGKREIQFAVDHIDML
jgi:single-stranded-DNA-specific exonuclease